MGTGSASAPPNSSLSRSASQGAEIDDEELGRVSLGDEHADKQVVSISDTEQDVEMAEVIAGSHILRPSTGVRKEV